ncbi:hypothetical protein Sm713_62870 [Streptomyces sp. TS71-3]|nr:hypothetical protein Sm713_62870 [Streptomyces sp. TS71-3]
MGVRVLADGRLRGSSEYALLRAPLALTRRRAGGEGQTLGVHADDVLRAGGGPVEHPPRGPDGPLLSGLTGAGRKAVGERDDEVAQFVGALDDEGPVE